MTVPLPTRPPSRATSSAGDGLFRGVIIGLSLVIVLVFVASVILLAQGSFPALSSFGAGFLTRTVWNPVTQQFGAAALIAGTLITSFAALVISVPLALCAAIFVAEYAPRWFAGPVGYLVELLAAVPSVVYGLWALFALKPLIQKFELSLYLNFPDLATTCATLHGSGRNSLQCFFFPEAPVGLGLALAVIILTIMILPYTASVARDVIQLVPSEQREAMYALGATKWEVISRAILPSARPGITGGVILALGRALGETLAVAMVIGNVPDFAKSIWGSTATMASMIALQFGDAQASLHRSSIITLGLLLFAVSVIVNYAARLIIARMSLRSGA